MDSQTLIIILSAAVVLLAAGIVAWSAVRSRRSQKLREVGS